MIALVMSPAGDQAAYVADRHDSLVVLWAWERREDLRFIDPATVSVAVLAGTIRLSGGSVAVRPRLPALIVPRGTTLLPVVRIETDHQSKPTLTALQRTQTLDAIVSLTELPTVQELQLDFDATVSERVFYRALLTDVRDRLPRAAQLSITALASWCFGDDWLDALPIDEAVPMLFRMGADDEGVRRMLAAHASFRSPLCKQSVGVAVDEPLPFLPAGRRVFLFAPLAWSSTSYQTALALAHRRTQ